VLTKRHYGRATIYGVLLTLVIIVGAACSKAGGSSGEAGSVRDVQTNGPAARSPLDAVVLKPADVGPAAISRTIQGGQEVAGQVTLDLCNAAYASEALRTARLQVAFLDGAGHVGASNEIVSYRPGGTRRAYRELTAAAGRCPGSYRERGATVSHIRFGPHVRRLGARQLVVSVLFSETSGPGHAWSAAVYQFRENLFSGVYAFGGTRRAALRLALRLGAMSAARLRVATARS